MTEKHAPSPKRGGAANLTITSIIALSGLIAISTCSRRHSDRTPEAPSTDTYRASAETLVKQHLRDPSSAEFSEERVIPGAAGKSTLVCGKVNAKNGFGGMTGNKRFVVGGTVVLEEEIGADLMTQLWNQSC